MWLGFSGATERNRLGLRRGAGTWGPPGIGGFVWALKVPPLNHSAFSSHMYFLGGVPCPLLSHLQRPKILKNAIRIFFFHGIKENWSSFKVCFLLLLFFPQCDPGNWSNELCNEYKSEVLPPFVLTTLGATSNKTKPCFQVELWPVCW